MGSARVLLFPVPRQQICVILSGPAGYTPPFIGIERYRGTLIAKSYQCHGLTQHMSMFLNDGRALS